MNGARRLSVRVTGRVQGVGFRHWAAHRARLMGLTGWIANQVDGSVTAVAEGSMTSLQLWLTDLGEGPSLARVEAVEPTFTPATREFLDFRER